MPIKHLRGLKCIEAYESERHIFRAYLRVPDGNHLVGVCEAMAICSDANQTVVSYKLDKYPDMSLITREKKTKVLIW